MRKQHILYIVAITMLFSLIITINNSSYINSNNVFALGYSSNVGIGFTFNPTLSVNIYPNDLIIPNLAPGTTSDSNIINVSVATNAAYGYTLSATVGDSLHNNTNLTHTNNTDVFSSIATNADLASLEDSEDSNIWGYSYKDNTAVSPAWNNYNGLSSFSNTVLLDTNTNSTSSNNSNGNSDNNNNVDSIDFKIAAKASDTQSSGVYTGTINFYATTKPTPITLSEAYASEGKTMINGYYTMQDMTSTICDKTEAIGAQLQVLDIRDYKLYWISKLADNHCWMTQNLDLDLDSNRTYTHWDTDLGWSTEDDGTEEGGIDENATWEPSHSTINFDGANTNQVLGWVNSNTEPYSANPGDIYYYTSGTGERDIKYNSLQECAIAGHNDCTHYHTGNYYNWSAALANNDTGEIVSGSAPSSICARGWRIPTTSIQDNKYNELGRVLYKYNIVTNIFSDADYVGYQANGFNNMRLSPLYIMRSGRINGGVLYEPGIYGSYWTNTIENKTNSRGLFFNNVQISFSFIYNRYGGWVVRCLAR